MTTVAIIAFTLTIIFLSYHDSRIWWKQLNDPENYIDHKSRWWVKAACSFPFVAILMLQFIHSNSDQDQASVYILSLITTVPMCMGWFALIFDFAYNLFRKKSIFYLGSDDEKEDSLSEDFFRSLPVWVGIFVKLFIIGLPGMYYFLWPLKDNV